VCDVPRFFFHVQNDTLVLDEEGMEFPDVDSAREEAIRACGEMIREVPEIFLPRRDMAAVGYRPAER